MNFKFTRNKETFTDFKIYHKNKLPLTKYAQYNKTIKYNNQKNIEQEDNSNNKNYSINEKYSDISQKISQNLETYIPKKIENYYEDIENSKDIESSKLVDIKELIGKDVYREININLLNEKFTNFNSGKISIKNFGLITSYAANTNQGIARNYNEDRVSIIINMNKPNEYKNSMPWPIISYFGIFDGHAGNKCAEFLRDNLLNMICCNPYFPKNITESIYFGFEKANSEFLKNYAIKNGNIYDNSGTCGLILLIVNEEIFIGNVGDSRCIASFKNGKIKKNVTRDHKPNQPFEKNRILLNGGRIYQTKTPILYNNYKNNIFNYNYEKYKNKFLLGPYRVFPGKLSVSRTIGDAEAKLVKFGGNPNVIISKPDIYKFNYNEDDIDYFILGCDGVFDNLSSEDVFHCVDIIVKKDKEILKNKNKNDNNMKCLYGDKMDIHKTSGNIVDFILKAALARKSLDNVTCLYIGFKDLLNEKHENLINHKNYSYDNILTMKNKLVNNKKIKNETSSHNYFSNKPNTKSKPKISQNTKNNSVRDKKLTITSSLKNIDFHNSSDNKYIKVGKNKINFPSKINLNSSSSFNNTLRNSYKIETNTKNHKSILTNFNNSVREIKFLFKKKLDCNKSNRVSPDDNRYLLTENIQKITSIHKNPRKTEIILKNGNYIRNVSGILTVMNNKFLHHSTSDYLKKETSTKKNYKIQLNQKILTRNLSGRNTTQNKATFKIRPVLIKRNSPPPYNKKIVSEISKYNEKLYFVRNKDSWFFKNSRGLSKSYE